MKRLFAVGVAVIAFAAFAEGEKKGEGKGEEKKAEKMAEKAEKMEGKGGEKMGEAKGEKMGADKGEKKGAKPPPISAMPEVKKVVDAFMGKWKEECEISMPGMEKPEKATLTADCKKIALGNGVGCEFDGKSPAMGPMQMSCMLAHDPAGTGVHMMCVTSDGEVHDHKGAWKDDKTLEFEPLKFNMEGKPATELVTLTSDGKTMGLKSTTQTAGGDMVFTCNAKKK